MVAPAPVIRCQSRNLNRRNLEMIDGRTPNSSCRAGPLVVQTSESYNSAPVAMSRKSPVIQRSAQPAVKRPATADSSSRAPVRPTDARSALPSIFFGHIDTRRQAGVRCALRSAIPLCDRSPWDPWRATGGTGSILPTLFCALPSLLAREQTEQRFAFAGSRKMSATPGETSWP
jgi:hypothetical protein